MNMEFGAISETNHEGFIIPFETMGFDREVEQLLEFLQRSIVEAVKTPNVKITIYIIAGEATHEEYSRAYDEFIELLNLPNVKLNMIAGPILSGDSDGNSMLLSLVDIFKTNDKFNLYIANKREDVHWKVVQRGKNPILMQLEHVHYAAAPSLCYKTMMDMNGYLINFGANSNLKHKNYDKSKFKRISEIKINHFKETISSCRKYTEFGNKPIILPTWMIVNLGDTRSWDLNESPQFESIGVRHLAFELERQVKNVANKRPIEPVSARIQSLGKQEEDEADVLEINGGAFLRSMAIVAWSSLRYPFATTNVDLLTGKIANYENS
jgi:hypothetical protein